MRKAFLLGCLMLAAAPAAAVTGSGSVNFEFLSFFGPVQQTAIFNPGDPPFTFGSDINGVQPTLSGFSVPQGPGSTTTYERGFTGFPAGTQVVNFGYEGIPANSIFRNIISFTPTTFSNVAAGDLFGLGTLTFQNGAWFGGGTTPAFNTRSVLPFRIWTTSSDGVAFNQETFGIVQLTVNALPGDPDYSIPANRDAEADWVTVFMGQDLTNERSWRRVGTFRVYDIGALPAGFTNSGTVDLRGRFGSLILADLTNAQGGFITEGDEALPGGGGGTGAIPEPATWAMMIAGFGLVGAAARRRRRMAAA